MSARCTIVYPVLALAALWALAVMPIPQSTWAQSSGGLKVRVTNGTPGGGSVVGVPVSVLAVQNGQQALVTQGYADANGSYVASNLALEGASYVISTTYEGVSYKTAPISLPVSAQEVQLPVYETTGDDANIRISRAGIVVLEVDAELQRIRFLETITLLNNGDRTFLPSTTGARGPLGLLRFGLPVGAGNLVVGQAMIGSTVTQDDTGFATDLPVPPEEMNVSYTYEMAYGALSEGGYALVNRNITYPVDSLQVLAVQGDFRLESPLLTDNGIVSVGSHTYRQFSASSLPANSEVSFELRDLPLIQPVLRPGNPWLQGVVGVLALLALLVPILYRRRYLRRLRPVLVEAAPLVSSRTRRTAVRRVVNRPPTSRGPRT